jgi:hypothetical protein
MIVSGSFINMLPFEDVFLSQDETVIMKQSCGVSSTPEKM